MGSDHSKSKQQKKNKVQAKNTEDKNQKTVAPVKINEISQKKPIQKSATPQVEQKKVPQIKQQIKANVQKGILVVQSTKSQAINNNQNKNEVKTKEPVGEIKRVTAQKQEINNRTMAGVAQKNEQNLREWSIYRGKKNILTRQDNQIAIKINQSAYNWVHFGICCNEKQLTQYNLQNYIFCNIGTSNIWIYGEKLQKQEAKQYAQAGQNIVMEYKYTEQKISIYWKTQNKLLGKVEIQGLILSKLIKNQQLVPYFCTYGFRYCSQKKQSVQWA